MSATFGLNELRVRPIGRTVTVPNNDVARLMYYLSCVCTVINYDEDNKFTDYQNYDLLTRGEILELLKLVILFVPKLFSEHGIFIVDEALVPSGMSNEFYEISDEKIGFHLSNEIIIGGMSVKVLKVMACTEEWIIRNYIKPLSNISNTIFKPEPPPPPRVVPIFLPPPPPPTSKRRKNDDEDCVCCSIF